jgi:hypothetical protein
VRESGLSGGGCVVSRGGGVRENGLRFGVSLLGRV